MSKNKPQDILFLPDLHLPACNWDAIEWAASVRDQFSIDRVIQLGDMWDQRIWSRFPNDPDFDNPDYEWDCIVEDTERLWNIFPKMNIIFGNHDGRIAKRAADAGLPYALVPKMYEIFNYEGWDFHVDASPLIIDGTIFIHGDEMSGGVGLRAAKLGLNLVQGHTHQGRLEHVVNFHKAVWGMECGCLVDNDSSNFRYAVKSPRKVWLGVGMVINGVPILLPYPGKGKW